MKRARGKKKVYPKIDGKAVRSNFEYTVYQDLLENLPKSAKIEYEPEKLEYTITAIYTPDFLITFEDGTKFYIEVKGNGWQFDSHVKRKLAAVKKQHPDKDIRIVFYRDDKIGPKRKDGSHLTQGGWATKHGYEYSVKEVPKEWVTIGKKNT